MWSPSRFTKSVWPNAHWVILCDCKPGRGRSLGNKWRSPIIVMEDLRWDCTALMLIVPRWNEWQWVREIWINCKCHCTFLLTIQILIEFAYICQKYFIGTRTIVRLAQCQWDILMNMDEMNLPHELLPPQTKHNQSMCLSRRMQYTLMVFSWRHPSSYLQYTPLSHLIRHHDPLTRAETYCYGHHGLHAVNQRTKISINCAAWG